MTDLAQLGILVTSSSAVEASGDLDVLAKSAARAETSVERLAVTSRQSSASMQQLVRSSSGGAQGLQNVGFQVQDFAVQIAAGTSATQALAQQLPQLLSGFGLLGIGLGTASAVLIPLAGHFLGAAEAAATFDDTLEGLTTLTQSLGEAQDILSLSNAQMIEQYGAMAGAVREAAEALVQLQSAEAAAALAKLIVDNAESLDLFTGQLSGLFQAGEASWEVINRLQTQFGITREEAEGLRSAFRDLRFAADFEGQQEALAQIQRLMAATGISAEQLPAPLRQALIQYNQLTIAGAELQAKADQANGVLRQMPPILQSAASAAGAAASAVSGIGAAAAGAIGQVQGLAAAMWDAAQARISANNALEALAFENSPGGQALNRYGGRGTSSTRPITMGNTGAPISGASGGGGGGGGGGADTFTPGLEALIAELRTEREIEDEWYQENLAILQDRRAEEILGAEAHKEALIALEMEYQQRIAAIEAEAHQRRLSDTAGLFGSLAEIASVGGAKAAKAVATFQAIEGTINAYGAAIKALNTNGISLPGRFAAYASVLAAGLKGVAAIRSAGGIGGGGGGAGIASQGSFTEAQPQSELVVRGIGRDREYSGQEVEQIVEAVFESIGRRGGNMGVVFTS
jgi:hypothetical protein